MKKYNRLCKTCLYFSPCKNKLKWVKRSTHVCHRFVLVTPHNDPYTETWLDDQEDRHLDMK